MKLIDTDRVKPESLKTREPFSAIFPIDEQKVEAIKQHMKEHGFDGSQPIIVWDHGDQKRVVIDGHMRLRAAREVGLKEVTATWLEFPDENAALQYAIHNQRDRRNLDDHAIYRCIEMVDKRKCQGERSDMASSDAKLGKSAEATAQVVGTSPRKVEKVRTIEAHADEETKQAVKGGKKSINRAYRETQEKQRRVLTTEDRALKLGKDIGRCLTKLREFAPLLDHDFPSAGLPEEFVSGAKDLHVFLAEVLLPRISPAENVVDRRSSADFGLQVLAQGGSGPTPMRRSSAEGSEASEGSS